MPKDTAQPDIRHVPLADLYLHDLNPRQSATEEQIEAKAASMATQTGLLHYLMAYDDPEHRGLGIVAGGLRWRGLQVLAAEGWSRHPDQPALDPVPVRVTSDPLEARAWALGDNVSHEAMTPAQEVRAYAAMRDTGMDAPGIARAMGKPERHVARRLALASLPKPALDALEAGEISIDVARVLTIARDEEKLLAALSHARAGAREHEVRRLLTPDSVPSTDHRARYVGLTAYFEAGGTATEDLFEDKQLLHDEDKLNALFEAKLTTAAARVQEDEGWAEAVPVFDSAHIEWRHIEHLTRLRREEVVLPEADLEELEQLEELGPDGLDEEGIARWDELLERQRGDFTDEDRARGTVFVYANPDGEITVDRAYTKPERKTSTASDGGGTSSPEPAKPAISQAVKDDLSRLQLAALMGALCDKTDLMLDLLAYQLDLRRPSWGAALNINVDYPHITPSFEDGLLLSERVTGLETAHNFDGEASWEGFQAFRDKGKKYRNEVLSRRLARAMNSVHHVNTFVGEIERELSPGLRAVWTPTAANFFNRVRSDYLDRIWADLLELEDGDERIATFAKQSKGQKAKDLEDLFSNAGAQEAHGLSRDQVKRIDAWVPEVGQ
ncbi:ParB/RepB/Spo0J family partition protein [Roseovarius indicus]|uniref:ParB/RepB/Spo0J family partition protein n=1 Tax=Roseovarius indicus TaxID=540747 RepID=UPI0007DA1B7E|nr:ParB/RepB/Spo0J family partition protein [Roseovarius indicus]OAO02683.1 hypothetical protein A8B76_04905 [Roseovarius indicus]